MRIHANLLRCTLVAWFVAIGFGASSARAQTTSWTDGTGNWFTPGNWSAGVPTGATGTTSVSNGGTAQINGAANAGTNLLISGGSTVELQTGGSLSATNTFTVGPNGTLLLSGSTAVTTTAGSSQIAVDGGALIAGTTGTLTAAIGVDNGFSATFGATAGNTLTLNGASIVLDGTTIHFGSASDTGTVVLEPASSAGISSVTAIAVDGGTLKIGNNLAAFFVDGATGGLTVGSGTTPATLDLNGATIAGSLQVFNLAGTSAGTITNSGAAVPLQTFNIVNSTFGGVIQDGANPGGIRLEVSGVGGTTLTLTGANTYTGGTTIDGGQTLQLGNGGTTGSIVGNVVDSGTLAFDRSNSLTLSGAISGGGAITVSGGGNLTLSGNNGGYSGTATINAGSLTLGSTNALGTGGVTFAGNNTALLATTTTTVSGPIDTAGVSATFGATAGSTLSLTGILTTGSGTALHFGSATDAGTVVLQSLQVGLPPAAVAVDGGTLKVGSANGASLLGSAPMTVGSSTTPATLDLNGFGVPANNLTGTSAGLITNSGAAATLQTFNSVNSTFAGVIQDGANPGGISLHVTSSGGGASLILTGANTYTGGTTIDAFSTLQLGNGGTSGSIVGNVTDNGTLTFDRSDNVSFGGAISGAGAIVQNGAGNVTLSGNNRGYSGTATINAGSLTLGSTNALGTGGVTFAGNNTALFATTTTTVSGPIDTAGVSATFGATAGSTLSLTGILTTGSGTALHFGSATDAGTVVLQSLQVGLPPAAVAVDGGTLKVGSANGASLLGSAPMTVGSSTTPATLDLNGFGVPANNLTGTSAGLITNSGAAATLQTFNSVNSTFAGVIQDGANPGGISLHVTSSGGGASLILTGANTYTGGTTIDAFSTLQLGNGGTSGSIVGNVTDNGTLTFDRSDNVSFGGAISGAGAIVQNGAGNVTLSGNNGGYSGTATINAGSLTLGSTNALGTGGVTFAGNNTALFAATSTTVSGLVLINAASTTFGATAGNTLTLAGQFGMNGGAGTTLHFGSATETGTVVLEANGLLIVPTGANAIDGGTLKIGNLLSASVISGVQGSLTVGSGTTAAALDLNGFGVTANNLTGTSAGTITNSGTATTLATFNNANTTFAGVIQDGANPGGLGLHVTGTGGTTLTLTGANTYTGGTTIDAGQTLQLGNGGTSGSIVGPVTDNGTLAFNRSNAYTFAEIISGNGSLVQNGSGTTILTNTNTYHGTTTVNAGTLEVDGSIANSTGVTVNSGGTLSGTGIVDPVATTTIMSGGTLAPGNAANPTGTLTITGNLAFQSGAVYLVQITPTTAANTNVTGSAILAGTAQAVLTPGSYAKQTYDILHAGGGLPGTTFAGLSFSTLNFSGSLTTSATDVFLNLTSATLGAGTPLNQNQQAVATAINGVFNSGGTLPANFVGIFNLTGTSLANALSQLDGEAATGGEHAAFQLTNEFLSLMLDPFVTGRGNSGGGGGALGFAPEAQANLPPEIALAYASVFTKAPPATSFEQRWSVWGSAYGGGSTTNGNPAVGSNNLTANAYGFAGGLDYRLSPTTVVGVALAGAGTNWGLANALGTGRSDAVQAGAYGISWFGQSYVSGALSLSNHWFSTNRTALGDTLTANFAGQSYGARLEGGYRYAVQPAFAVTPYAALQLQDFRTPAYNEIDQTGGAFGLAFNAMNATDVRSELGARFDDHTLLNGKPLILFGRLAWAHDFVGNPSLSAAFQTLPGAAFTVNGAPIPHDSAISTAGAQLYLAPQWSFIAKFDGEFAGGSQTYAGTGTLRHTW